MDPSERNIENTEPKGFISPVTTRRNLQNMQCCSVKGLLPLGWALKERAGQCEETCLTPQMLCGIPRGNLSWVTLVCRGSSSRVLGAKVDDVSSKLV